MNNQPRNTNDLILYRERIGLTQRQVSRLLGHRSTGPLSKFEQGHRLPNIPTALKLAIIYRVPVDFLYSILYSKLREQVRAFEQKISKPTPSLKPHSRRHHAYS